MDFFLKTVIFLLIIASAFIINKITVTLSNFKDEPRLNFTELTKAEGYTTEEHIVVTEDGYHLAVFRIIEAKLCKNKMFPPVLLMHGLIQSSDLFLDAGPDAGLAYLLADACYDVWVGNTRGNNYARKHVKLNPDVDEEFWDFSADEIGAYDLPAKIDYILKLTGVDKLIYMGYSQGGSTIFILCSERPEYCDRLSVIISLAPAAKMGSSRSKAFGLLTNVVMNMEGILNYVGLHELFSKRGTLQSLAESLCDFNVYLRSIICKNILAILDTHNAGSIHDKTLRLAFKHFPAGTSVKNIARYGQMAKTGLFRKYDYGVAKNIEKYGNIDPPAYNLTLIKVPVIIFQGVNDYLVDIKDSISTVKELNNAELFVVDDPKWNHFDLVYSQYIKTTIFVKINEYLSKYKFYT